MVRTSLWLVAGLTSTAAGAAGIVLPLVPTTPFLLLAAYCFARSSPVIHNWLLTHPALGKPIGDWQRHRAICRRTKAVSTGMMALFFAGSVVVGFAPWILAIQALTMIAAASFILSRAGRPGDGA